MKSITFATPEQAAIFEHEIVGQLSDGMWENSRPWEHWKFWSDIDIQVGDEVGVTDCPSWQKRNYNLLALVATDMPKCIMDRMRTYAAAAQIGLRGPNSTVIEYAATLGYDKFVEKFQRAASASSAPSAKKYWLEQIPLVAREDVTRLRAAYLNYSEKKVRNDLRSIKKAMATDRTA